MCDLHKRDDYTESDVPADIADTSGRRLWYPGIDSFGLAPFVTSTGQDDKEFWVTYSSFLSVYISQ